MADDGSRTEPKPVQSLKALQMFSFMARSMKESRGSLQNRASLSDCLKPPANDSLSGRPECLSGGPECLSGRPECLSGRPE